MPDDADLTKLLECDEAIEDLEAQVADAADNLKALKECLKAEQRARRNLSHEIRNPPPLFAGEPARGLPEHVPDSVSFSGSDFTAIKQAGKALRKRAAAEGRP